MVENFLRYLILTDSGARLDSVELELDSSLGEKMRQIAVIITITRRIMMGIAILALLFSVFELFL